MAFSEVSGLYITVSNLLQSLEESSIYTNPLPESRPTSPSWRIGADVREIFVDLVALAPDGKTAHFVRTLNRKDQLVSGINEAISLLPSDVTECIQSGEARILVVSDFERVSLRENWGSHAALIATEGFENLLEIQFQQRKNTFGLHAEKLNATISKDFTFGIAERTLANGTVEKHLAPDEIETIASKLALSEVKNVAIGFLHSLKNPANEKELAANLKAKGFEVFLSSEEEGSELQRTQKSAEKAFLASGLKEMCEKIQNAGFKSENILVKRERPTFSKSGPQNSLYIEFLEDRIILKNEKIHRELELSPLSIVELDEGGYVHIGATKVDSEPGPVAFGKGLQMTVFDVVALNSKMSVVGMPRLKLDSSKVLRQLGPLAKNLRLDVETCREKCLNLFYESLALEIEKYLGEVPSFVVAGGWLAPYLAPTLARRLGAHKIFIPPHTPWLCALELLETEIDSKVETTKTGVFSGEIPGSLSEGAIHDL